MRLFGYKLSCFMGLSPLVASALACLPGGVVIASLRCVSTELLQRPRIRVLRSVTFECWTQFRDSGLCWFAFVQPDRTITGSCTPIASRL
jgi:hypothetical protein